MSKVGILGTGAYGISLALTSYQNNHEVMLWTKFKEEKNYIEKYHENDTLPSVIIPDDVKVTNSLKELVEFSEFIIIALPVRFLSSTLENLKKYDVSNKSFCLASKGIQHENHLLVHQIFESYINNDNYSVISGPSFAIDIVGDTPIGMNLYATNNKVFNLTKKVLESNVIHFEKTDDLVGIELSGSIKNVLAIASGILQGFDTSDSTNAFFMVKAIRDLTYLIIRLGGKEETVVSPCCLGDLILTCNSINSRNYTYGELITRDREEAKAFLKDNTVEGYYTLITIIELLQKKKIKIKIIDYLKRIVINGENSELIMEYLK